MNTLKTVFSLLDRWQKIKFFLVVLARLALVVFDLAGVALIGLTVSILSGIQISASSISQQFINALNDQGLTNTPLVIAAMAVGFFLIKAIASILLNYLVSKYVLRIEFSNTVAAYRGIFSSDLDYLDAHRPKDLLHGVTGSANMAFSQTLLSASVIIGELFLLISISFYLFLTNSFLFWLVGIFFLGFTLSLNHFVNRRTKLSSEQLQDSSLSVARALLEAVPMLRQIKFSGNSEQFVKKFKTFKFTQAKATAELMVVGFLPRYITEVALMVGLASLIALRSMGFLDNVGAPEIAIFAGGAFRIVASLLPLQAALANLKRAGVESREALSMYRNFQEPTSSKPGPGTKPKNIVFHHVSFRYSSQDAPILDEISFEIPAGSFALIEGSSGSGKSTLADLMLGLRTPTVGKITIGSQPARDFFLKYPTAIGYMPQKPEYFSGTIRENITLSFNLGSANSDKLLAAISAAGLADVILELPLGLDTVLGESGIELSGGQAQRLALARVLYQDPSIVLLDESTSALDIKNQQFVLNTLSNLVPQKTIIVISHSENFKKLATLRIVFESNGIRLISRRGQKKTKDENHK